MKQTITIKDVAKELSCSISTVSRAFNDKYDIHPQTRKMILQRAKEMGYSPNPMARRLTQKRSFLIGVVVPEFVNDFFPQVIMGIQNVVSAAGYQVLIMSSHESAKDELDIVRTLETNQVDGIIISFSYQSKDMSYYQMMLERNFPIVQFNRVSNKLNTYKVVFDDYQWAVYAVEHLIRQGHRKIYHLSGPDNLIITHNRKRGFIDAMKKNNLECSSDSIIESGIFIQDGQTSVRHLIEQNDIPDAIFCFNDPLAIGAMQEFKSNGYHIPEDVAFVGFSESDVAKYLTPSLTSVRQPTKELGETVARLLLEQINNQGFSISQTIMLSGQLNIRESSIRL